MPEHFYQDLPTLRPAKLVAAAAGGVGGAAAAAHGATVGAAPAPAAAWSKAKVEVEVDGTRVEIADGHVAIASITSCTNTSNPLLMLAAGLLARNAVHKGLKPAPGVRTSMAPGSRAVTGYLDRAGLLPYLEELGFQTVGYGCATCIGNSGPLAPELAAAAKDGGLVLTAVLSGNRNFEARIHPLVRANYLGSPPLVVAYALAGAVDFDLTGRPLGHDAEGDPVYLAELWPDAEELATLAKETVAPDLFATEYAVALRGTEAWRSLPVPGGSLFAWDPDSTYVREPPFFMDFSPEPTPPRDIRDARVLAVFGDSVTTDHISPAGTIQPDSPAGRYLISRGVDPADFNTYGARRGNHEVLLRGTFANVRLRNAVAGGREGGWTTHQPSGELMPIYDAAMRYHDESVSLVIFAGKEYGTGSSRDWAAKGPALLGVQAVIAGSFERIHRSNLVGMGILPLEFEPGMNVARLGLDGTERVDIEGVGHGLGPGSRVTVRVCRMGEADKVFGCRVRLDSSVDVEYYRNGGVLPRVLRRKLSGTCP
jgi:aconitate hydratase